MKLRISELASGLGRLRTSNLGLKVQLIPVIMVPRVFFPQLPTVLPLQRLSALIAPSPVFEIDGLEDFNVVQNLKRFIGIIALIKSMADQEHVHIDSVPRQNGPTGQRQHSFNSPNFQDLVFEDADFGPLHEDFFDSAAILTPLQGSDSLPPTGGLEGHFGSTTQYPHVANEHAPIDFGDGVQDCAPHSQDLESVGCLTPQTSNGLDIDWLDRSFRTITVRAYLSRRTF